MNNYDQGDWKGHNPSFISLKIGEELRISIQSTTNPIQIKLVSGTAEYFGHELVIDKTYTFHYNKCFLFTWNGCVLEVSGQNIAEHTYVSNSNHQTMMNIIDIYMKTIDKLKDENKRVLFLGKSSSTIKTIFRLFYSYSRRKISDLYVLNLNNRKQNGNLGITLPECLSLCKTDPNIGLMEIPLFDDCIGFEFHKLISYLGNEECSPIVLEKINDIMIGLASTTLIFGNLEKWNQWSAQEWDLFLTKWKIDDVIVVGDEDFQQKLQNYNIRLQKNQNLYFIHILSGYAAFDTNWSQLKLQNQYKQYFYNTDLITKDVLLKPNTSPNIKLLSWKQNQWFKLKTAHNKQWNESILPIQSEEEKKEKNKIILEPILKWNQLKIKQLVAVFNNDGITDLPITIGFICIENINEQTGGITILNPTAEEFPINVKFCVGELLVL